MKKAMGVALGLFLLTSCGNSSFGPGFEVTGGVSGAQVDVNVTYSQDASGNPVVKPPRYTLRQPTVSFVAHAGSLGGTVHSASVSVKDASGNPYGQQVGKYTQSFAAAITPGWACTAGGAPDLQNAPIGCTNPVPVQRVSTAELAASQLISPQVAEQAAADCASAFGCTANLRADITFNVTDSQGAARTIVVNNVPISVYANYSSEEKQ